MLLNDPRCLLSQRNLVLCTSTASCFLQPGRSRLNSSPTNRPSVTHKAQLKKFHPKNKNAGIKTLGFGSNQNTLAFQSFVPTQMALALSTGLPPRPAHLPPHVSTLLARDGNTWSESELDSHRELMDATVDTTATNTATARGRGPDNSKMGF